jgi:hypothetical protein
MRAPIHRRDDDFVDGFVEPDASDFVVAEDEIEAWELDAQDLGGLNAADDGFNASKLRLSLRLRRATGDLPSRSRSASQSLQTQPLLGEERLAVIPALQLIGIPVAVPR